MSQIRQLGARRRLRALPSAFVVVLAIAVLAGACSEKADVPPGVGASLPPPSPPTGGSPSSNPPDAGIDATIRDAAPDTRDAADAKPCLGDTADGGAPASKCPTTGACAASCARVANHYRAGVAEAAIACVNKSCTSVASLSLCVDSALAEACPEGTAASYCRPLVTACDPDAGGIGSTISQEGCESFANGLSAAGRSVFASCLQAKITAGTCARENAACADEIRR